MTDSLKRSGNRTWMYIAGAVVAVALAALVAVSVTSGDSKKTTPEQLVGVEEVTTLFDGIPQSGLTIGKDTAPVTITEFLDMQCPFCAQASINTVPSLVTRYVKSGQVKLVMQPLGFIGPDSERGALAVIAAGDQKAAAQMAELLFRNQGAENGGWLSDDMVKKAAAALTLDTGKLDDARGGSAAKKAFDASVAAGKTGNVQSTPTFKVKGSKGEYTIRDASNLGEFDQAIAAVK